MVVSGTLLLIYGAGAIIGPLIAGPIMSQFGDAGLFFYIGGVFAGLGLYAVWRRTRRAAPPLAEQGATVHAPATTPLAASLDPQATSEETLPAEHPK